MVFDLSMNGFQPRLRISAVFNSERECNELGRQIEREYDYEDNSLRSFSICIPEDAFNDTEMQVQDLRAQAGN